ncbi:hypothetical protein PV458_11065 [Streptomyces sp. MN03-5084-2B]|nr:hypothetical protein [Streptomyces sp. MN03-5084-2B]
MKSSISERRGEELFQLRDFCFEVGVLAGHPRLLEFEMGLLLLLDRVGARSRVGFRVLLHQPQGGCLGAEGFPFRPLCVPLCLSLLTCIRCRSSLPLALATGRVPLHLNENPGTPCHRCSALSGRLLDRRNLPRTGLKAQCADVEVDRSPERY